VYIICQQDVFNDAEELDAEGGVFYGYLDSKRMQRIKQIAHIGRITLVCTLRNRKGLEIKNRGHFTTIIQDILKKNRDSAFP
jgi:hypothetical protein